MNIFRSEQLSLGLESQTNQSTSYENKNNSTRKSISPAFELRLHSGDKLETPVDSRGIIDPNLLIGAVKSTILDSDYRWRGEPDPHHLYWTSARFSTASLWRQNDRLLEKFRDLSIHKVMLPREFHDYLHFVTEPPEIPTEEVMQYRVQSWLVAERLFEKFDIINKRVSESMPRRREQLRMYPDTIPQEFAGKDLVANAWYQDVVDKHFPSLEWHYDRLRNVPEEFNLIPRQLVEDMLGRGAKLSEENLDSIRTATDSIKWIGSLASKRADTRYLKSLPRDR